MICTDDLEQTVRIKRRRIVKGKKLCLEEKKEDCKIVDMMSLFESIVLRKQMAK